MSADPMRATQSPAPTEAPGVRVVLVTTPSVEIAGQLARALVEERLAACANILPGLRSIYRWEGTIHEDAEALLLLKTRTERCAALAARVKDLHPYELPEVLELPVTGGSDAYLDWVITESTS